MKILQISDIHFPLVDSGARPRLFDHPKRWIGGLNYLLRRYARYKEASSKLNALKEFLQETKVDVLVITGDLTTLGMNSEHKYALQQVQELTQLTPQLLLLPGNHDLYVPEKCIPIFYQTFAHLLVSDLPEYQVDGVWPLVRFVGDDVAFVLINSAKANPLLWRSSGRIQKSQLDVLPQLLKDSRLISRTRFILSHYPLCKGDGLPESSLRHLENHHELEKILKNEEQTLYLHGHIHKGFRLNLPNFAPPIFCAGSLTAQGKEGAWFFDVKNKNIAYQRLAWDGKKYYLTPAETHSF